MHPYIRGWVSPQSTVRRIKPCHIGSRPVNIECVRNRAGKVQKFIGSLKHHNLECIAIGEDSTGRIEYECIQRVRLDNNNGWVTVWIADCILPYYNAHNDGRFHNTVRIGERKYERVRRNAGKDKSFLGRSKIDNGAPTRYEEFPAVRLHYIRLTGIGYIGGIGYTDPHGIAT